MTKDMTLAELQAQIEELQNKAKAIIQAEKAGVIDELKAKISQYGITASELGFKLAEAGKPAKASNTGKGAAPKIPKYKNPQTGETWNAGKGASPLWIIELANKHLADKKVENKDGNMVVPRPILTQWLDDNGYKLPEPVAETAQEETK